MLSARDRLTHPIYLPAGHRQGRRQRRAHRERPADTLARGLADEEFWDGKGSVRLLTWLHAAVAGGFLAIVLGVTVRALGGGSSHASALGWTGIWLGAATIVLAVGYIFLDVLDTPSMTATNPLPTLGALAEKLRGLVVYLVVPAGSIGSPVMSAAQGRHPRLRLSRSRQPHQGRPRRPPGRLRRALTSLDPAAAPQGFAPARTTGGTRCSVSTSSCRPRN